jgi:3-hydroxyacyl-[acyl-carrier-protein] dehydratase
MRLEYFQMLDRIVDVDLGARTIRTACQVPQANESPVFEGHFPGYPLMPGVLLIECMAQTTGWLASALVDFNVMPILARVKEGKMRNAVFPGDALEFDGKIIHEGSGFTVGEVKGRRADKPVCEAEITYRMLPYPNPAFRTAIREWAVRLQFPFKEPAK